MLRTTGYLLSAIVFFTSCIRDFDRPSWNIEALAPVLNTSLDIYDVVNDPSLISRNDSVMVVFAQNLTPFTIDTLLSFDVKPFIRHVKLDSIRLNDQIIHYRQTLAELTDSAIPDGTVLFIPLALPLLISDTLDGSQYFSSIDLNEGMMYMTINNHLPANMINVYDTLFNAQSHTVVQNSYYGSIASGTVLRDSFNLAGRTIEGVMEISIGGTVNIPAGSVLRWNDYLEVTVELRKMKINSAQALFPAQTIIHHTEEVYLEDMDDREIVFARIRNGQLRVSVVSTIEQETYFTYTIPNATYGGLQFSENMTVPPAPPGGSISRQFLYAFDHFEFNFRGQNNDTVNAFYNELIGTIDSSQSQVFLTLQDSVDVVVEVLGLQPEYARGFLGRDTFNVAADTSLFKAFSMFALDSLSIAGAKVSLCIENSLGMEGALNINTIRAVNSKTKRAAQLDLSLLPDTIFIAKAVDGSPVIPMVTRFQLNDANSNISKMISVLPDQFIFSLDVLTNPKGNNHGYTDFAYASNLLNTFLNIEAPLAVSINGLVLKDETNFLSAGMEDMQKILSATLYFIINNGFPLTAQIRFDFFDAWGTWLLAFSPASAIAAADIHPVTGRVMEKKQTTLSYFLDEPDMPKILQSATIAVTLTLSTMPQAKHVQIYDFYTMDINATAKFNYTVKK